MRLNIAVSAADETEIKKIKHFHLKHLQSQIKACYICAQKHEIHSDTSSSFSYLPSGRLIMICREIT